MNNGDRSFIDLVVSGEIKKQSVLERINRRLKVLRKWRDEGIPIGKTIPKSLNAVRVWEDLQLEIHSISSPNDFITTHHVYGTQVREIAKLLDELRTRFQRPRNSRPLPARIVSKASDDAMKAQLEAAVSQWHMERDQRLTDKRMAEATANRDALLLQEKEQIIADLRRQLVAQTGLRVVE